MKNEGRKYYIWTGVALLGFFFYCLIVLLSKEQSFNLLSIYILLTIFGMETIAELVMTYSKNITVYEGSENKTKVKRK